MGKAFGGITFAKAEKKAKKVIKKDVRKAVKPAVKKAVKKAVKPAVRKEAKKDLKPIVRKINKLAGEIQREAYQAGIGNMKLHSHHGSKHEAAKVVAELRAKGHIVRGLERRGRIAVYYK